LITLVNLSGDPLTGEKVLPLGALAIATTLQDAGFPVDLRDLQVRDGMSWSVEGLADALQTDAPVLGVSLMSDRMPEAVFALRLFKARNPATVVIVGGAGPTECAEPLLKAFDHIDCAVVGEGEATIVEVMTALRDTGVAGLHGIAGIVARVDGELWVGPPRERLRDLDALAWPEACTWPLHAYDSTSIVTARGCPFPCSFCSIVNQWGRKLRARSVPRVIEEIAWLQRRRPGSFLHIEDDTFTVDRRRVLAFCDALQGAGLAIEWGCTARIDAIDEALVERMVAAGCRSVFVGIESGSDDVRARVHKRFASEQVFAGIEMLLRHVEVTAHYIWGYPFETFADLRQTFLHLGYLTALGATARHSHLVPFPRSPLMQSWRGELEFRTSYPFARLFLLDPAAPYLDEVRANPEVFMPYFCVPTPELDAKFAFVARYGEFERAA